MLHTSNFNRIHIPIILAEMEKESSLPFTTLDEAVGMLTKRKEITDILF